MKILVTGASGQLGKEIHSMVEEKGSKLSSIDFIYSSVEIKYLNSKDLDISDLDEVSKLIWDFKPNMIINCAAYTNVDQCETDIDHAFKVNSLGPRNLAIAAEKIGAKLIHISTDYVFKGDGRVPYKEYDISQPLTVYGKTKLLGEKYVSEFCSRYFIIRTSWLYGKYGKNFVYTMLNTARERDYLEVVNDQIGNPTNAEDLAYHILKIALTEEYGIYHCTGNGECSWYDFACKIVEYAEIDCEIKPITSDKLNRKAKRPTYSCLDNMMLRCTVGDEMRNWDEALKSFIQKDNYVIQSKKREVK